MVLGGPRIGYMVYGGSKPLYGEQKLWGSGGNGERKVTTIAGVALLLLAAFSYVAFDPFFNLVGWIRRRGAVFSVYSLACF